MSNFCEQCGTSLPENARFCESCGHRVITLEKVEERSPPPEQKPPIRPESPVTSRWRKILVLGVGLVFLLIAVAVISIIRWKGTQETRPPEPSFVHPLPPSPPPPQAAWGGRWPWTSQRLIRDDDLWPLSRWELELMRNEIYARHGWVFNRRDLQNYFEGQPWYRPKGDLSNREQANRWAEAELTPLERKNIQIIVSREKALKR